MDDSEISAFSRLFLSVDVRHRQALLDMTGAPRDLYERVLPILQHIPEGHLQALLPSEKRRKGDLRDSNLYIYFRPIQDDHVAGWSLPVVSLRYDFDKNPLEIRILVALAQLVDDRVRFYGFRFEAPEGAGGGRHDFYHVQLIRSFRRDGKALNPPGTALAVVPEKQPAFPLRAEDPVSLVAAFFVSLYGMPLLIELSKAGELHEKYLEKFR
jgi:hypothetical protein